MRREFKKGEKIFALNPIESDPNGFGIVLEDKVAEYDDDIVDIQVISSGEIQEYADRIYKLAPNRICSRCGCVVCVEHIEMGGEYPYYCPYHDESLCEIETDVVDDETYQECFQDSVNIFLCEE